MEFEILQSKLTDNFTGNVINNKLFETDADTDYLWELYLKSFPEGTNPLFRVRREYDCSCCRHFIKSIGGTVYIDAELKAHSIFEFDTGSPVFQPVMDALSDYVKSCTIKGLYLSTSPVVGTPISHEVNDGQVTTWNHFFVKLPESMMHKGSITIDTVKGKFRDTRNVFKRSLDEISDYALDTVIELINSNTLYKGEEWKPALLQFAKHKAEYQNMASEKQELYCWRMSGEVGTVVGRIRNHSIGVLLTDISSGVELDEAVSRYERIVAPTNYKRPKAIYTKRMLEDAAAKITELGYMDSLPRRFATLDDIRVNNILFSNRDAAKRIGGTVFDEMASDVAISPKQFSRAESIAADKFVSDVLPGVKELEAYVENRHSSNLVSLIAPANSDAPTMFKWNNGFSWAYTGNLTDSDIRENVKSAGGKVDGVLRFSIQWNDGNEHDGNDVDAHCIEPNGAHISYCNKLDYHSGGNLDVDIVNPIHGTAAVENITWPQKNRMAKGKYKFFVHCFSARGGRSGFRAEIEFDGNIYRFDYAKTLKQDENVNVATVTLDADGKFSIHEDLPADMSGREMWSIKTNTFVPVSVAMYSPNYWDEQSGIGHRHYMFMLKDCVNPERPNGFYNEFLKNELAEHKRVLEALGSKMAVEDVPDQLSGLGFSSTKRNDLVLRVKGATERVIKIMF